MNLEELYKELGITDYNIEVYTQVLMTLQKTRQELISAIQEKINEEDNGGSQT